MNKILIAVDNTEGTREMFKKIVKTCKCMGPEEIILLYVEKLEGGSLMDEMLGKAEMSELKRAMEGTDVKGALDKKAAGILDYYKKLLQNSPPPPEIKTVVRSGHPAEEIINESDEKGANLIVIGTKSKKVSRFFIGSVSREVVMNSSVPVLVVK